MNLKALVLAGTALVALVPGSTLAKGAQPAPLSSLIAQVDIPYTSFTLANGLRVIVHTDRRAPVVAVSVWYDVGSKHEPEGRTGFAHLFEHLMFNGSENAPGDFFAPLKEMGATGYNGSTYFDRTNYFETVPTGGLERTLFLESDRMGWLTGAITQATLNAQRGVVQNEKRQGDNQPYGLVQYSLAEGLYPRDHPYAHTPIGSMADLDKASLQDVRGWFREHYGPNNAVLSLAGDIDEARARRLVEKYFGAIPRGARNALPEVPLPTLPAPVTKELTDDVASTMILRSWVVPGLNDADADALDVAAGVLGGLGSSRFDQTLVRGENLAVSASASNSSLAQAGTFSLQAMVRPGVDPAQVARRLDEVLAAFVASGPTEDEVRRVATRAITEMVESFEDVSDKAATLAEGELYSGDPGHFRNRLADLAAMTPERVRAAAAKWLTRPAYTLVVKPGTRSAYEESATQAAAPARSQTPPSPTAPAPKGTRGAMPPVDAAVDLEVPSVERAQLSNGIEIAYTHQQAVPFTRIALSLDAGAAADAGQPGGEGVQSLVLAMLREGTERRSALDIAREEESLGAETGANATFDRTQLTLVTPSVNLNLSLDLLADMALHPRFDAAALARKKDQALSSIAQQLSSPASLASQTMGPMLYGAASPYARAQSPGDPAVVRALTSQDLRAFHRAWFRPEKARFFVTSDRSLAEVSAALERVFAKWPVSGTAGTKTFPESSSPAQPQIVLIDRPGSPQSYILGGFPSTLNPRGDTLAAEAANQALGGDFLSRLNMNLREDKHWSYGVRGSFSVSEHAMPYVVSAPVQVDKTGAAIAEMRTEMCAFVTDRPLAAAELQRTVAGAIRSLPGVFAGSDNVLAAMQRNALLGRPDDYYANLATRYRSLEPASAGAAFAHALDVDRGIWVVVGDAQKVRPQLDALGLPVRVEHGAEMPRE